MSARVESLMRELAAAIREDICALPCGVLSLAEEIKCARSIAKMSLQDVADASGFTKSHVWEMEQGRAKNPTVGMLVGLSKALGIPFLRLAQAAMNTVIETSPPLPAWSSGLDIGSVAMTDVSASTPKEPRMTENPEEIWLDIDEGFLGRGGPLNAWPVPYEGSVHFLLASPELLALVEAAKTYGGNLVGEPGSAQREDQVYGKSLKKAAFAYAKSLQPKEPGHGE